MVKYITECNYCGHRDKFCTTLPEDLRCSHCGSTIAPNKIYHPDRFDVFGYNYKEKELRDNNKHEDLLEEFERLVKEGEEEGRQEEVQEGTERSESD